MVIDVLRDWVRQVPTGARCVRLRIDEYGLDYDTDYGAVGRTGWSAIHDGSVIVQFVSLDDALAALAKA